MSVVPWSLRPKIDELSLSDRFMRRVPTGGANLNQETSLSDLSDFLLGLTTVNVASEADFPAPTNGFIRLENGIKYILTAPVSVTSPILMEAGVVTIIDTSFAPLNKITFTGFAGTAIKTLNLEGAITAFANSDVSPGVKTKVTSVGHGLSENDKVNISGVTPETQYNGIGRTVTNVTTNTFDIEVVFGATDTGDFETGLIFLSLKARIDDGTGATLQAFDLTYTPLSPGSTLEVQAAVFNFLNIGIVRGAIFCGLDNALFIINSEGLVLEDVANTRSAFTQFLSNDGASTATAITFQGASTLNLDMLTSSFNLASSNAFPMKINTDIDAAATMKIENSGNLGPAGVYFNGTGGGIDQTDIRVSLVNCKPSPDSQSMSESRTDGVLEVDGSGGPNVFEPIVDITPVSGDWIEDATTEEWTVDPTTGLATYNGLDPKSATIRYELSATQTSGGTAQTLLFEIRINGISQPKSQRTIVTTGVGSFTQVTYIGGSFDIVTGDTVQLFKNNTGGTTNTDIQDATVLIIKNG